ncbi:MAG: hypothetical protein NTW19_24925 [Planctomycetota bacterium]|nr:hypothetical protein [Planctomycetota bacterium]
MTTTHAPYRRLFVENIHPRVLVSPDELPALKARAKTGLNARALAEVVRRSHLWTDPDSPQRIDPALGLEAAKKRSDPVLGGELHQAIHALGFAYAFTGNKLWADRAVPLLRMMCAKGVDETDFYATTSDGALPIAYDLLAPGLSADDRRFVEVYLRRGIELYEAGVLNRTGTLWGLGTNLFFHTFELYVMQLAAVFDNVTDWPRLDKINELIRMGIHHGLDEGGAIYEGPSYGTGDAAWISTVAEVLLRAGVADLWTEEPKFAAMVRHWAYLILPGMRGQNPIGDAWRYKKGHPHWAAALHAARLNDDALWWVWEQMRSRTTQGPPGEEQPMPEFIEYRLGWTLLYENEAARVVTPGQAGWPSARNSGSFGVITMRSGWQDDDLYFSLLAAGRTPGCCIHQHVDAGHFSLFALGEAFSIDTGYGDAMGKFHSVLMPYGDEPRAAPHGFDHMWNGGRVQSFAAGKKADYACVDVHDAWECRWALRGALTVRAAGAEPYVLILDDFNPSPTLASFLWLMNSEPGNRVEIDAQAERVTVQGKRNRLELAWSHPGPADYPVEHRVELDTDTIDSMGLPHRTEGVNYFHGSAGASWPRGGGRWGAGMRPRVKALLYGYNGQLLTALLPRRAGTPAVGVQRIFAPAQFGLTLDHGNGVIDTVVASPISSGLDIGGITGEARLAVVRRDGSGKVVWWAAAEAFTLAIDGKTVLPRRGEVRTLVESA